MSKTQTLYVPCPNCGKFAQYLAYSSINESIPNAYKKIIGDEINFGNCSNCGNRFQLTTGLLYCNHKREFAAYYHPSSFSEIDSSSAELSRILGANSHLAKPIKFQDWDKFKAAILRFEQSPDHTSEVSAPSRITAHPKKEEVKKPNRRGLFTIVKRWFGIGDKSEPVSTVPQPAEKTQPSKAQEHLPTQPSAPTIPHVVAPVTTAPKPARPVPPPAPLPPVPVVATPLVTKLTQADRGNHKLFLSKVASPLFPKAVILGDVLMPQREYEDLVISLGYGQWTEERATINQLVKRIFTNRTKGLRVFDSEADYTAFVRTNLPGSGYETNAKNAWFRTIALPLSVLVSEVEAVQFIEQQSIAYSRTAAMGSTATLPAVAEKLVPSSPQPSSVSSVTIPTKKADWAAFQKLLRDHNITKLYHFTDRANLDSIRSVGGLLSWYSCKQRSIDIPRPGGSSLSWELDSGKGLADYVRLSFTRSHPMMHVALSDGRISAPVVLEIDPEVIFWESTKFTTANAAKSGIRATSSFDSFSGIDFSLFNRRYFDLSADDKSRYQAEVLIHQMLPVNHILNLAQVSI